ncbi:hypothetical protein RI129_003212 [Pyrocoelia pectoralis]|uniref:Peptidase M14 domain-containing protein n=1 Tax=Pyrocoelia pectoralis TaxID=417401 RepID=A0AAN7ZIG6_9COLE
MFLMLKFVLIDTFVTKMYVYFQLILLLFIVVIDLQIQAYLNQLHQTYQRTVQLKHFGLSVENRNLTAIKISTGGNNRRPLIFIDAGIHAREWLGPAQAIYIIKQLVENSRLLKRVDWLIVPLLNPDGYEYCHVVDRLWRKNRSKGQGCRGVDLNRNFDFQWSQHSKFDHECSNTFAGQYPFSEPESLALSKILLEYAHRTKIYISLHSAAQSILYPWGYTTEVPNNGKELHRLAAKFSDAIYQVNFTEYKVGSAANILYLVSGTSRDWAYGVANIRLSYTVELKGVQSHILERRFQIPPEQIFSAVSEMFEGIKQLHSYIEGRYGY